MSAISDVAAARRRCAGCQRGSQRDGVSPDVVIAVEEPSGGRTAARRSPRHATPHGPERTGVVPVHRRTHSSHAALAVLLGPNGLRVSEACGANVEDLGFERGHRTQRIIGKENKSATIPLAPRTGHTLDLAIGERTEGPILTRNDGRRLDSRTAYRWVRAVGKRAGLDHVHPHMLRAAFIMAALDAGVPLRDVQVAARHADQRTTTIYDRRRQNFDRHAAYDLIAFVTSG